MESVMRTLKHRFLQAAAALLLAANAVGATALPDPQATLPLDRLAPQLQVGDLVFIRVGFKPFREVAAATGSWTNHVGIVVATEGGQVQVAESTVPLSRRTPLDAFVARSEGGRVAVRRLATPLTADQAARVDVAARQRQGVVYDTGFNLQSRGQFCSRFVHEVLRDATGQAVGTVQTFEQLLQSRPQADTGFWRLWYFGRIPWQRQTVTPASVLDSPLLQPVFDGSVAAPADA
jgi:Permuted papain-like amidase enzyme, YaeF/YiiX, C92 family